MHTGSAVMPIWQKWGLGIARSPHPGWSVTPIPPLGLNKFIAHPNPQHVIKKNEHTHLPSRKQKFVRFCILAPIRTEIRCPLRTLRSRHCHTPQSVGVRCWFHSFLEQRENQQRHNRTLFEFYCFTTVFLVIILWNLNHGCCPTCPTCPHHHQRHTGTCIERSRAQPYATVPAPVRIT